MDRIRTLKPEVFVIVAIATLVWAVGTLETIRNPPSEDQPTETAEAVDPSERSNLVVLAQDVYERLQETADPQIETGWCTHGRRTGSVYWVDRADLAEMLERSRTHVRMRCERSPSFLGHIHSHPRSNTPRPSRQDIRSLIETHDRQNPSIEGIFTPRDGEIRFYRVAEDDESVTLLEILIRER